MTDLPVVGIPSWRHKVTWSGGAWDSEYGVQQLGLLPLGKPAVTEDAEPASTKIIGTLTEFLPVQYLLWVGHNAGLDDRFTWRCYADEAREDLVLTQADLEFWLPVYPKGSVPYGHPAWWTEKYTADEIATIPSPLRPVWLDEPIGIRAFEIDVDVTASGITEFAVGLLDIGLGTQLEAGFDYGAEYGYEARRVTTIAPGGTTHRSDDPEPRTWNGTFSHVSHAVAMSTFFEQRRSGEPFLWLPRPDNPETWLKEAWFAELVDPSPIARAYADVDAVPLSHREVF